MDLQVGWPEGYNIMHKEPVDFYTCMWRLPYPISKISASTYRGWHLKHQFPCLTHKVPPLLSHESQPSIYESKKTTSSFHWVRYRIQTGLFWEFGSCTWLLPHAGPLFPKQIHSWSLPYTESPFHSVDT
jgi:hypothetical protein